MKQYNPEAGLSLEIDDTLLSQLSELGRNHYPKEFGGLLIGRYSEDRKTVLVTDTLLPNQFISSRFGFERKTSDLRAELERLYNHDPPLHYVGEWHTHPDCPPTPSSTDKRAMQEIASGPEVFIRNPILLIVSMTKSSAQPKFFFYHQDVLTAYDD